MGDSGMILHDFPSSSPEDGEERGSGEAQAAEGVNPRARGYTHPGAGPGLSLPLKGRVTPGGRGTSAEPGFDRTARIAAARAEMAKLAEAYPDAPLRIKARQARLAEASRHERDRVDYLVLGKPRPEPKTIVRKRHGRRKVVDRVPVILSPGIEERVAIAERFGGYGEATAETMWHHEVHRHTGALAQLHRNQSINDHQLDWAMQIAYAAESIERDVDVRTASLEARVDQSRRGATVEQRLGVVRLHMAYTRWRQQLPQPKRLVLDMLVGEPIGFSVAAQRFHVHKRKAKRYLVEAIDRWPDCMKWAEAWVLQDDLDRVQAALA